MNDIKFCVLIHGSDELYAMPNKEVAEKCAKAHTQMMIPWMKKEQAKGEMLWLTEKMIAGEVIEWPHGNEEFEEALKEFNFKDWGLEQEQPDHE